MRRDDICLYLGPADRAKLVPIKAPKAGIAVAGICAQCWSEKTTQEIENAALALMRRNLGTRGGFAD